MREFLTDFLNGLMMMLILVLFIGGLIGPMILAATVSPWFGFGYFVTIPLVCACLNYFMNKFNF